MGRRFGQVDLDTGELFDGVVVLVGRKIKSPYGKQWMAMNQKFLEEFAARKDVHAETLRVFLYLNARLDFENLIQLPQVEIAEALSMERQNVNRAMSQLEELGIIFRGPKVGRSSTYRLNPMAGWKGKVKNLKPAIARHLKTINGGRDERDPNTQDMFKKAP
jgi:DNA-binding MarR family transcriptional regulator